MTSIDETDGRQATGDPPGSLELRHSAEVAGGTPDEPPGVLAAHHDGAGTPDAPEESTRRRRPVRTTLLVLIAIAVAAAAGVAATGALGGGGDDEGSSAAPSGPVATAKVQRTTLTSTETVDGNLGYGEETAVRAPAAGDGSSGQSSPGGQPAQGDSSAGGAGAGIVTWLPDDGTVIDRGETVYKVDQEKVPLLYGSTPLYRTLSDGSEGSDVKMLEENLSELGYDGFTVDDEYTSTTAAAVEEWQDDLGRDETGTVGPGDAVVADGARRVAKAKLAPGDAVSGDILTWTGTERMITLDLDVDYEDQVEKGTKATVTLPDDTEVEAVVTDVGTPTTPDSDGASAGTDTSKEATLPVELKVKDQKKLGRYQAAAVDVELKDQTRENVLAVPVNALLAERDGGYVVEVVTNGKSQYRPVELGMFAGGMVEVSGAGITEGTVVGVPK
ncbi:peptidoglycan-binding protein [Streptomyces fumanus]|uniref:Peptidoglycan-binding protein n=1 Tax=Streptomyces fumanus TaxID=67302 RepID=A0A919E0W0_9ACTN|nr:peptidoglycan-binding protein [Streptomyces fumanus]GHF07638.1 peptidoglycan-binding protein [Streptomyces fumanus]